MVKLHLLALGAAVKVHTQTQSEYSGVNVEALSEVLPCWPRGARAGFRPSRPANVAYFIFYEVKGSR